MASREIEWLKREVDAWERDGIVDTATAERLRTRYAQVAANETPWGRIIFGSLGALLVGLGIIALLAANWSELGRPTRTVIAFTPLSLCAILYVTGYLRGWSSRAFLEPLGLFWGLSIGAGVALIGQTYHLPQDAEAFTLVWTLLLIPVCYATRALAPVAGYFIGLITWVSMSQLSGGVGLWYWPLAALVAPLIYGGAGRMRQCVQLGCCGAPPVARRHCYHAGEEPAGLWMIIYTSAFAALLLGARYAAAGSADGGATPCGRSAVEVWPWCFTS